LLEGGRRAGGREGGRKQSKPKCIACDRTVGGVFVLNPDTHVDDVGVVALCGELDGLHEGVDVVHAMDESLEGWSVEGVVPELGGVGYARRGGLGVVYDVYLRKFSSLTLLGKERPSAMKESAGDAVLLRTKAGQVLELRIG
jgi:hypothetical protein